MNISKWLSLCVTTLVISALPASNNYKINNFGFGSGGVGNSSSANYGANGITGESSGADGFSANFKGKSGEINTQQANVPDAPTFDNTANYYNKLHFVVNKANTGNPSDTLFAIAISSDNFVTTQYVQSDNTVGSVLGIEDYQTYAAWGSITGQFVIGLNANTTYKIKVKAMSGRFSESAYSPAASATTSPPTLTYDIDVSATDTETSPPYTVTIGNLLPGGIVDSPQRVWVDIDTNAESGGNVYISSLNAGLNSSSVAYTIISHTGDLSVLAEGEGAQGTSSTQTSGGPLTLASPFDGTSNSIGTTDTIIRKIFTVANPVVAGRGSFIIKAKSNTSTPSSADYSDILTVIAAASF